MVKTQLRFEIRLRRKFAEKKWPTYTESVKYKMWWVPLKPCLVEIFENLSEKCKRQNWKVFFKNVFSCFQEIGRDNFVNYATAQLFIFFFFFFFLFLSLLFIIFLSSDQSRLPATLSNHVRCRCVWRHECKVCDLCKHFFLIILWVI